MIFDSDDGGPTTIKCPIQAQDNQPTPLSNPRGESLNVHKNNDLTRWCVVLPYFSKCQAPRFAMKQRAGFMYDQRRSTIQGTIIRDRLFCSFFVQVAFLDYTPKKQKQQRKPFERRMCTSSCFLLPKVSCVDPEARPFYWLGVIEVKRNRTVICQKQTR